MIIYSSKIDTINRIGILSMSNSDVLFHIVNDCDDLTNIITMLVRLLIKKKLKNIWHIIKYVMI
jgi:hypothetical protein